MSHTRFPAPLRLACAVLACAAGTSFVSALEIPLSGRTVDPTGAPLIGATVLLIPAAGPAETWQAALAGKQHVDPIASVSTGADGGYRIVAPNTGFWRVRVEAPGFVPQESAVLPLLEETVLADAHLVRDEGLSIQLLLPGGQPAAGALVRCGPAGRGPRFGSSDWAAVESRWARCDGEGKARLPRGPREALDLVATIPGAAPLIREAVRGARIEARFATGQPTRVLVSDADRKPVVGALIALGSPANPVATTAADGGAIVSLATGPTSAVVIAPDERRAVLTLTPNTEPNAPPQRVELPAMASIQGRVIDAATRRPVAGALLSTERRQPRTGRSGADGRFTLTVPAEGGDLELTASAIGFLDASIETPAQSSTTPATIALQPAASVTGTVLDPGGKPIVGARVTVVVKPQGPRMMRRGMWRGMRGLPEARTSLRGTFRLPRLDPDEQYDLTARSSGFAPQTVPVTGLLARQTKAGLVLTLNPGLEIRGTVVDGEGRAIPGATVSARSAPAERQGRMMVVIAGEAEGRAADPNATTDQAGHFSIAELAPGRYDLRTARRGYATTKTPGVELSEQTPIHEAGRIQLEAGDAVQGQVLDRTGQPLEAVDIRIVPSDPIEAMTSRFRPTEPDATTGTDGWFTLPDRRTGETLDLIAMREGFVPVTKSRVAVPLAEPLVFTLEPSSKLAGQVLDHEGRPVPSATVLLSRTRNEGIGGRAMSMQFAYDTQADRNGAFEFEAVEPGRVTLSAEAPGMQKRSLPSLEVPLGKDVSGVELRLEPGALIEGRVLSASGAPVIGAEVGLVEEGEERGPMRALGQRATTDGDGRYRLDGLAPARVAIEATAEGYPRAVRETEIQSGSNRLDLTLSGGTDVSGRVIDPGGAPIGGATVRLNVAGRFWGGPEVRSGADGRFIFNGVAPGEYSLAASSDGYVASDELATVHVEAEPVTDQTVTLTRGGAIVGSILGLDPKEFGDVEIEIEGVRWNGVRPDFKGNFRIDDVPAGTHTVVARLGTTGRRAQGSAKLETGALETRVDLSFGSGLTLSGIATQGERPADGASVAMLRLDGDGNGWARADNQGRFRIEALEAGRYRLEVRWRGAASREQTIDLANDREITVELPEAELIGSVIDAVSREPIAGAQVTLESLDPEPGPRSPFSGYGATSDVGGRFVLSGVADDTYRMLVKVKGYAAADQSVTVHDGSGPDDLTVRLDPTEGLSLDIRLPGGAIPSEVQIAVLDPTGRTVISGGYPTGENGRVRISTVPPGRWELLVGAGGGATANLSASAPGGPIVVTLPASTSLRVQVEELLDAADRASLSLIGADGRSYRTIRPWGGLQSAWPLTNGRVTLEALPPGRWTVKVDASDGRSWEGTVTTAAGALATLEL